MKTFVAIPAQNTIDTSFARSLVNLKIDDQVSINFSESSLVYDSRNKLTTAAIASESDYILWFDTDMVFAPDLYKKLKADIKQGADMVCGLYFARRPPFQPVIYKKIRQGLEPQDNISERYDDYPESSLFEIDACGFGAVLMKTKVAAEVVKNFHEAFGPVKGYGEDISFCIRAKRLGFKILCDSAVKVDHMGMFAVNESVSKQYAATTKGLNNADNS